MCAPSQHTHTHTAKHPHICHSPVGTCVRIVYAPKTKRPPIATVGKMDVGLDEARGTRAGEEGGGRAEGGSRRTRGAGTQGALQSRKVKVFFPPMAVIRSLCATQ